MKKDSSKVKRDITLTNRLVGTLCVGSDILVDDRLWAFLLVEGLVFSVLRNELCLKLHHGIFNTGSWQILDLSLRDGWRGVIESSIIAVSLVHILGDRIVTLACVVAIRAIVVRTVALILRVSALASLARALCLRVCCNQSCLDRAVLCAGLRNGATSRRCRWIKLSSVLGG